eukprot:3151468-Rhodomonas_salina.1
MLRVSSRGLCGAARRGVTLGGGRAVGAVQRREHVHEGFDFGRATRVVHQLVRRHMPHLPSYAPLSSFRFIPFDCV